MNRGWQGDVLSEEIGAGSQSDAELLHAIRRDVRAVYDEVSRKPLPSDIMARSIGSTWWKTCIPNQ